jgi:hypothetical protein
MELVHARQRANHIAVCRRFKTDQTPLHATQRRRFSGNPKFHVTTTTATTAAAVVIVVVTAVVVVVVDDVVVIVGVFVERRRPFVKG